MAEDDAPPVAFGDLTTRRAPELSGPGGRSGLLPALTILHHPRLERVGERAVLQDLTTREAIGLSRMEPSFAAPSASSAAPLGDAHLSRRPIRIVALPGGHLRLDPSESGTRAEVEGAPLVASLDFSFESVSKGIVIELAGRVVLLLHLTDPPCALEDRFGLVGDNYLLERVRRDVRRVADLDVPVLVRGETGTGKELVAQAIHKAGGRSAGPFLAVNMAAIPPSLAAAELFGAEKGAYTGALRSHPGYFGLANHGSLFLDEVGEAPSDVQAMLLRALETGEIQAVGTQQPRRANVRLIAATDADLEAKVEAGSFRAPLLHRLAGYEILLPPLRERRDDIGRLLVHFLRDELAQLGDLQRLTSQRDEAPWFPASLTARLARYDWPGNVRQLRNVVRQLVVGSRGAACLEGGPALERLLGRAALESRRRGDASAGEPAMEQSERADLQKAGSGGAGPGWRRPSDVSEEELIAALRRSRWDLKATSSLLRVSRTSLYALMESCPRVRRAGDLKPDELIACHRECAGDIDRMVERLEVSRRALLRRIRELGLGSSAD